MFDRFSRTVKLALTVFVASTLMVAFVNISPASALRGTAQTPGNFEPFTANGSISGSVTTSSGGPASNVSVELTDGNGIPQGQISVVTASDGTFNMSNVPVGNWFVAATPPPESSDVRSNPTPAQVGDGQAVTGINLHLQTTTVVGHVFAPSPSTQGVQNAMVQFFIPNVSQTNVVTSNDGSYRAHVDAGTYTGQANAPFSDPSLASSSPSEVVVPTQPTDPITVDFHLTVANNGGGGGGNGGGGNGGGGGGQQQQGNVNGHVFEPGSSTTPVANAQVRLQSGFQQFGNAQTDSSGAFSIAASAGTYQVVVSPPNGSAFAGSSDVSLVVAQDGSVVSPNPLNVHLNNANVSGHVFLADGTTPAQNANVQVNNQDNSFGASANTDSAGAYHLFVPESSSTYNLVANPSFGSPLARSLPSVLTVPQGGGSATAAPGFDLRLRTVNVSGHVFEPGSSTTPVQNANINVHSSDFSYQDGTSTDNTGTFGFAVPPGTYTLSVGAPQNSSFSAAAEITIVVDSGGVLTSPQSLNVHLTEPNVIGHVYQPGSSTTPVGNAGVSVHTSDFSTFSNAQTSNDGSFALNLSPGTYVLSAEAPWGSSDFVRSAEATIHIDQSGHLTETSPLVVHLNSPNVTSQVLLPGGGSAGNANVQVRSSDYRTFSQAQADSTGHFRFNLSAGSYVLFADPPQGASGAGRSAEVSFTVLHNGTVTGLPATISLRVPNVTGNVYQPGSSTTPVANAQLSIRSQSDPTFFLGTQSDNAGAFALTLAPGVYTVTANPPQGSAYGNSIDTTITVPNTGSITTVLHLTTPNVTGTVLAPSPSSTAIANANVSISAVDQPVFFNTQTDNSGNFHLTVPNGSYRVSVEAPNGSPYARSLDSTLDISNDAPTANLNLRLTIANVTGTLVDTGGSPVSGGNISLQDNANAFFANAQTDNSGQFRIFAPPGTYSLTSMPPSGSTDAGSDPQTVVIANDGSGGAGLQLQFSSANVNGLVLPPAPSNAPVANTFVTIHTSDWLTQVNAQTDQSGGFHAHLAPGDYIASAQPPYGDARYGRSFDATIHVGQSGDTQATLRLTAPNVTGTVYLPNGTAVPNVNVNVHDETNSFFTNAQTDAQGTFRLSVPGNATYIANAEAPSGTSLSASTPVNLTVDQNGTLTAPVPLTLTLTNPALVGQVFDPGPTGSTSDDVAVHGGYVNVHNNNFTVQQGAQIRQDGRFSVGGLAAGTYTADVYPPWGSQGLLHSAVAVVVPSNSAQLPVTVESSSGLGRVYLGVASQTISVAVRRGDNSHVTTGADVQAFDQSGQFTDVQTVDGSGNYILHVTPGVWNVNVSSTNTANDWVFTSKPISVDPASCGSAPCVTLPVVQAGAHVTGTLTFNGSPVAANSANIDVRTPNGTGNYGNVGAGGHFDVRVPPGTYQVSVHPQDDSVGGPAPVSVTVAGSNTTDVGTLALVGRNSRVQGSVAFANPNPDATPTPVVGAHVYAFQPGGGEFVDGNTQSDGTYSLNLTPGDWHVGIFAQAGDNWIYNNPPQVVTVGSNQTHGGVNFTVSPSAATLRGQVLAPDGSVAAIDGFVQATSSNGAGGGAPLQNGTFAIPLAAGTFSLQLFVAPNTPYSPPAGQQVTVGANGQVDPVTIQLVSNDKEVTGHVVDSSGSPVTNADVAVSATKGSSYTETHTDSNGVYHLPLANGVWNLNARVATPGFNILELRDSGGNAVTGPVTLDNAHASVTRNIAIVSASRTITGSVHNSNGDPVAGAFINVDSALGAATTVHTGANSDAAGTFSVAVPDGTYVLNASGGAPGDVAPPAVTVAINGSGQTPASAVFNFRHPASTISGRVTSGGSSIRATVQAWSGSGGFATATSDASTGVYSIPVTDNDTWHVSASAPDPNSAGSTLLGPNASVPLGAGASATGIDFALAPVVVPSGLTTTFDAAGGRTISLGGDTPSPSDDVTIVVPAGALATTGNVSVTATPIASPNETSSTHPIGLGYSFDAFDATGQPIRNSFNRPLTITFGYDPAELADNGLTPDDLTPSYWDPSSQTYRRTDTAVVDTTAHRITFTTDHFTSWVVAASATAPTAPTAVTATASGATSAVVNWTAPASDGGSAITGYTVTSSGGPTATVGAGATSATVSGLTTGTSYTFTVHATNLVGNGVESAPTGVLVAGGGGSSQVSGAGYVLVASDGGVFNHGGAGFFGGAGSLKLNSPIVGGASTSTSQGYWLVASDGGVFSYGDAQFYGSTGGIKLNKPIVGMASTPSGHGYWLAASDGGVFAFGDALFYGSTGSIKLAKPIVGVSATPTGHGYWLVASDGGVFAFGDAVFHGAAAGTKLNKPVVAMHRTASGLGYWLVTSDGGVFSYGDAVFYGSTGGLKLNKPVVAMKVTSTGNGYWLITSDGGVFSFGDAVFGGSEASVKLNKPVIGVVG